VVGFTVMLLTLGWHPHETHKVTPAPASHAFEATAP